jgi:glucose/arabinose dehydrogenase
VAREGDSIHATFLDITDRVGSGGERGLLSLAFHPRFRDNGRVFVNYTDRRGHTHVAEFRADTGATRADPASERRILFVRQPYANHNGGHVLFGPDGGLFVGMGDGGLAGDPGGRAQDPRSNLGKLLRITVDQSGTEPPTNQGPPRAIQPWGMGLRNPWRFWFDEGLLYIADVGQNRWEEINVAPADSIVINYGWRTMEGAHCFLNPVCKKSGLYPPVLEYGRDDGCSVIGGVVYRGARVPALTGHYLYSDYCTGWLKSFRYAGGAVTERRNWDVPSPGPVLSFGVDGHGEVYVLALNGTAYRIEAAR